MDTFIKARIEEYSQVRYDFDPKALSRQEINEIKELASEKRADYGIAPIGANIFRYIVEKENNLFFETEAFDNKDLDALIYMPNANNNIAFIIINSNQSLLNQIFATAHEYYHYLRDIDDIRKNPRACSLSNQKEKSEQKASRFAAEFLLPDEALKRHINKWFELIKKEKIKDADLQEIAVLCYLLTIKFGLPLKAVLFRLCEEEYIDDIGQYLSNYNFLKGTLSEAKTIFSKQVKELLNNDNPYIDDNMYAIIPKAFERGYVSIDKLEKEIKILNLDKEYFSDILKIAEDNEEDEEDEISNELKEKLMSKLHG